MNRYYENKSPLDAELQNKDEFSMSKHRGFRGKSAAGDNLIKMKKIKFYSDVREMEMERIREINDMSPVERIKNTVELIRRIYP
ncbi:MAG: hypothetical protein WBP41_13760, partial [Saprospiraceae bacterium]